MSDLTVVRAQYADRIARSAGVRFRPVRDAFARVPREAYLGPGPWMIWTRDGYQKSSTAHPALLYDDLVFALVPERVINNGQPSLHARCLDALRPRAGEVMLHVGGGSGYYTAILAELAGPTGRVEAFEIDPVLAERAETILAERPNIVLHRRDGTLAPLPAADVIYVNAGTSRPVPAWLDALRAGGRLLFPLTPGWSMGAMLLVEPGQGRESRSYPARFVTPAQFIPCLGAQDDRTARRLADAFATGGQDRVRALHLGRAPMREQVWFAAEDWWLSTDALR